MSEDNMLYMWTWPQSYSDDPGPFAWTGIETSDMRTWRFPCDATPVAVDNGSDRKMSDTGRVPSVAVAGDTTDRMPATSSEDTDTKHASVHKPSAGHWSDDTPLAVEEDNYAADT